MKSATIVPRLFVIMTISASAVGSNAMAAEPFIAPEPEPAEFVKICDAYGRSYFYIPGTETCMRFSGYARYTIEGGTNAYDGKAFGGWQNFGRLSMQITTASETDYGTLRTHVETRFNWSADASKTNTYGREEQENNLEYAYINLNGFVVGLAPTAFTNFINLGNVINDDVISQGAFTPTGQISYTYSNSGGLTATVALEQGYEDYIIADYTPYVTGTFQYTQGWGSVAAAAAFDSVIKEWSGLANVNLNLTDEFSIWAAGGYSGAATPNQAYGSWGGKWAVWGGLAYQFTKKASFNIQAATEDWGKISTTANIVFEPISGLAITPEVTWTRFKSNQHYAGFEQKNAVQGMLRVERSF